MADGPTRATCDSVDERDGWSCVRCGVSLYSTSGSRHHRKRRRSGGHGAANLVLLCGSGTTGCHGWAHAHPDEARLVGLIVPTWLDPLDVPVLLLRTWALLDDEGHVERITDEDARRRQSDLGLLA